MTKTKGLLWLGVISVIGVLAVTQLNIFGGPGEPLRVHTPTKIAVDDAKVVRFYAAWQRDHVPSIVTYWIGNTEVQLYSWQLPALREHWKLEVPYSSGQIYAMTVDAPRTATSSVRTDCEISLIPSGFHDADRAYGRTGAHCWINAAQ